MTSNLNDVDNKHVEFDSFNRPFFLRAFAMIYLGAFTSLFVQFDGLYGNDGLCPLTDTIPSPTAGWFFDPIASRTLYMSKSLYTEFLCFTGMILSSWFLFVSQAYAAPIMGILWLLYLSIYTVGQVFLSFQWDLLILETGALFILLPLGRKSSRAVVWNLRFLIFKLMLMAGAVKLQSKCPTWWELTALQFHFATQCLPTPIAWFTHQLPAEFLRISVAAALFIEGPATLLLVVPSNTARKFGAVLQIVLQVSIMLSGNYTFFNVLTIILTLSVLDSQQPQQSSSQGGVSKGFQFLLTVGFCIASVTYMFKLQNSRVELNLSYDEMQHAVSQCVIAGLILTVTSMLVSSAVQLVTLACKTIGIRRKGHERWRDFKELCVQVALAVCCAGIFTTSAFTLSSLDPSLSSVAPKSVQNLYKLAQPWHIAHPYGLFRTMTGVKQVEGSLIVARPEIIIEGTGDNGKTWKAYSFKYKPGDVSSAPTFVAPHQPRIDWQMWFAALGNYQSSPWFVHLADKLLEGSPAVKRLLDTARDPFPDTPPDFIRAKLYHYDFTSHNSSNWWKREYVSEYLPALERNNPSVKKFLSAYGWDVDNFYASNCECDGNIASVNHKLQCQVCSKLQEVHDKDGTVYLSQVVIGFMVLLGVVKNLVKHCCMDSSKRKDNFYSSSVLINKLKHD